MAIRADKLALLDLEEHSLPASVAYELSEGRGLLKPREVIPVHCRRMKDPTAVRARRAFLQAGVPATELALPSLVVGGSPLLVRLIVLGCRP